MPIRVRFFASLKEQLGCHEKTLNAEGIQTVEDVWKAVNPQLPLPAHVLSAVNMDYADAGTRVSDGDEVAFFPPVTGG